jgi:hypothetical protein
MTDLRNGIAHGVGTQRRRRGERASSGDVKVQLVALSSETGGGEREWHEAMQHVELVLLEVLLRAEAAVDDALEREPKVFREHGVDEGIDGGIAVAHPEENREQNLVDAVLAEGSNQIQREEWQPAEDKHSCGA